MSAEKFLEAMQELVRHADKGAVIVLEPRGLQLLINLASAGSRLATMDVSLAGKIIENDKDLWEDPVTVGKITNPVRGKIFRHRLKKLRNADRAAEMAQALADAEKSAST